MMTTKTILSMTLGLLLAACAAETEPGDGTSNPQSGTSGTQPVASSDAPEYAISCQGEVTKTSFTTSVGTRCVGGAPGTKCGGDPCAPQAVEVTYVPPANRCGSVDRFAWNGTSCMKYETNPGGQMRCKGVDCDKLFTTEALCLAAYASCTPKAP